MTPETLLFVGGGTGGHVFPLLAVAEAVRELVPELRLVFVGTERGLERRLVPQRGFALELVSVLPIRGGGLAGAVRGVARAAASIPQARALVSRYAPRGVFSVGGYAAGPVSLAARTLGVPLALLEPNAQIGLANRLIAPWVGRAYTAFPDSARHFPSVAVRQLGVPLRPGFEPAPLQRQEGCVRVLVLGGSQGAQVLNETVPRALAGLERARVRHQAGGAHEPATRALYAELGFGDRAEVTPFIDDMPRALAEADLVIGRAGANAVAEICAVGRPSILIPYPFAGDHQRFNAIALERAGAARVVLAQHASAARLEQEVRELVAEPARLQQMAERAGTLGRPGAAGAIARDFLTSLGLTPVPRSAPISVPGASEPSGRGFGFAEVR